MSVKIFFCYAHEDEDLLNKLKSHLRPLQRQGLIDVWHDRDISAGTEWEREISQHLNNAQIVLLLVSPDFMDSDYCYGVEMKRALERHERGATRVIPIILRHVYWQGEPLGKLQALPKDARPVKSWSDQDEAFYNIAEGIRKVVEELMANSLLALAKKPDGLILLHSLEGHTGSVWSVVISPDGQSLVSGSWDKTIKVWNVQTGHLLRSLKGHTGSVWSVVISPDGQSLVSGSGDKTIKVWNVQTGNLLRSLKGHTDAVSSIAISPDGQILVSGSEDETIKVWNVRTGDLLRSLREHTDAVSSVAISPDGQTVVSGSLDMTIKIWGKK
ncbi:MAG: TIR domain-containing protein [Ktedonobacteraceae bacterium]|nr:TIR domain-containing protein [Ktedonobacteraceae bacterium]